MKKGLSASETVEQWCRDFYKTFRKKGLADALELHSPPQDALRVWRKVIDAMAETVKVLNEAAEHVEQHPNCGEKGRRCLQVLNDRAKDLGSVVEKANHLEPREPWHVLPGDDPCWEPTGYSGHAGATQNILADCLRWMSVKPQLKDAAEQIKQSLTVFQSCAEAADRSDPDTHTPTILEGWKHGKLVLKQLPNGTKPAVFGFGYETFTVPSGKAWDTVCKLIEADAFDGHGLEMKSPSEQFRREHLPFFRKRMTKNDSGWFIKTLESGKKTL